MSIPVGSLEEFEAFMEELALIREWREQEYSWAEIAADLELGSETAARRHTRNLEDLEANPPEGLEHSDFTKESLKQTITAKRSANKRYIITTITAKAKTNQKAFLSLLNAAKELDAELVLLLGRSHNKPMQKQIPHYDPWLKQFRDKVTFAEEYIFNESIRAVDLQINPQQLNPLTGIKGLNFGKHQSSVIIASTQIALESEARGNGRSPRVVAGTGTISMPHYLKDTRTGRMAEQNHDFGAVMLEISTEKKFFMRILEIDGDSGIFFDIAKGECKQYSPDGSKPARAEAWILGDKHIGHDCQVTWAAQKQLAKIANPKAYALHDLIDGSSVHKHAWDKLLTREMRPFFSIEDELKAVGYFLEDMKELLPNAKGFIVDSNHTDHISDYLDRGRYLKDKINYDIGHRMIVDFLDNKNPFQLRCDPKERLTWLTANDDYYICDVNIAMHGHRGPNGSKGSIKNIANIEDKAVIGHSHSPGWYRSIVQIGHSSTEDHGYNQGPSSWITADGLIFKKGLRQLIMYIDGEFYLDKAA